MSNALAIATATQALALLIENNLRPEIDMAVSVETRRPPTEPPTEPTITVFLYQVTPNASMRHYDLPTRSSDGTLLKQPAAPLDLHYLISAYGEETELVGQRLIGCVVRTLQEIPVLPRELIEEAAQRPYLAGSDLAESIQKVRFTPTQMDVDETSKLWGMLHQTPYQLSVAYQGVLVFVEGREQPTVAPPVERHTVHVAPFGAPGAPERPEPPEFPEPPQPPQWFGGDGGEGRDGGQGGDAAPISPQPTAEDDSGPGKALTTEASPPAKKTAKRAAKKGTASKAVSRQASKTAAKSSESGAGRARTRKATGGPRGATRGDGSATRGEADAASPPTGSAGGDEHTDGQ